MKRKDFVPYGVLKHPLGVPIDGKKKEQNVKLTQDEFNDLIYGIEGIISDQFAERGIEYSSYPHSAIDEDVKKVFKANNIKIEVKE